MSAISKPGMLFGRRFDSFEELAQMAVAWDLDFRQLDSPRSASELLQAQLGSLLVSSARFGCHVDQRGATPAGMRTFAIPDADCSEMRWFGRPVDRNSLLTFPTNGELHAVSRPGFAVTTVSVPQALLDRYAALGEGGAPANDRGAETMTPAPPGTLDGLRSLSKRLSAAVANSGDGGCGQVIADIEDETLSALMRVLGGGTPTRERDTRAGNRRRLRQLLDYVDGHADTPLRVADLCAVARVSERTLQNLFRRELGMTPKTYLCGQRLYGAHRALRTAQASGCRVMDVANAWGFWHMGQFARDYRKLFGELPSDTLRCSG